MAASAQLVFADWKHLNESEFNQACLAVRAEMRAMPQEACSGQHGLPHLDNLLRFSAPIGRLAAPQKNMRLSQDQQAHFAPFLINNCTSVIITSDIWLSLSLSLSLSLFLY
jgi:hypothetical protein